MKRILFFREDPHRKYVTYLRFAEHVCGQRYKIARRPTWFMKSEFKVVNYLIVLFGEILMCLSMPFRVSQDKIFVREFSSVVWLVFLPLALPFRKRFVLNINANLNNRVEKNIIKHVISRYLTVVFLCPTDEILLEYKCIVPIRPIWGASVDGVSASQVLLFVGVRNEQWRIDVMNYIEKARAVFENCGVPLYVVGKVKGESRLDYLALDSDVTFIEHAKNSICVFLYDDNAYRVRHSGLLWDLLLNGAFVCYPRSPMFISQAQNFLNCISFCGIEEFIAVMNSVRGRFFKTEVNSLGGKPMGTM